MSRPDPAVIQSLAVAAGSIKRDRPQKLIPKPAWTFRTANCAEIYAVQAPGTCKVGSHRESPIANGTRKLIRVPGVRQVRCFDRG